MTHADVHARGGGGGGARRSATHGQGAAIYEVGNFSIEPVFNVWFSCIRTFLLQSVTARG